MLRRIACPMLLVVVVLARQRAVPVLTAHQGFRISGTLVNAITGQVVANAEVVIGISQKQEPKQRVVTGADGRFQFDDLAVGKYWLVADREGFRRQGYQEHEGYFTGIAVGPNLQSEGLVFRLRPDASVSGMVTDDQNDPVRDAQVMLFYSGTENGRRMTSLREQVTTDDQGHYHFGHLGPGTYFVAVSARPWYAQDRSGWSGLFDSRTSSPAEMSFTIDGASGGEPNRSLDVAYPITYYSGVTDAEEAFALVLKAGDRASADVSLNPVPAVHLRIKDRDIDPSRRNGLISANLVQRVFDTDISVPGQSLQINKGEIEMGGVPPGQFEMNLQSSGKNQASWTQSVNLSNDVDISATETPAPSVISGVVKVDGGPGLARRSFIQLRNRTSGVALGTMVSAKGEFEFPPTEVKPGSYEIAVFNVQGAVVSSVSATGAKVTGHSIEVKGDAPIKLTVVMSQALAHIEGITLKDGKPMGGVMIVLVPEDPENNATLFRRDQSDSDGTFSLRLVPRGSYTVLAIENGWDLEWLNSDILKPYVKNGAHIQVMTPQQYDVKVKVQ